MFYSASIYIWSKLIENMNTSTSDNVRDEELLTDLKTHEVKEEGVGQSLIRLTGEEFKLIII